MATLCMSATGNNVEIGSFHVVCRGTETLNDWLIGEFPKHEDHLDVTAC